MAEFISAVTLSSEFPEFEIRDVTDTRRDILAVHFSTKFNDMVPNICDSNALARNGLVEVCSAEITMAIGASETHKSTGLPARLFYTRYLTSPTFDVYGSIEGPQAFRQPFVGLIETVPEKRRQGLALSTLPLLRRICQVVYSAPLTNGPEEYISSDGRGLLDGVAKYVN